MQKENKGTLAEQKNYRRHMRVWKLARVLVRPWITRKMGFTGDIAPDSLQGPYIVLSNHNSDFDPILIGLSFPQQMYYIAAEQVYRAGFKSALLKRYLEPISKIKGASDVLAVMQAIRKVKNGYNLCFFPEGNKSFNGKTGPIQEATGKLVKMSGGGLVTYRIEGEYLSTPRWATGGMRKGKIHGKIVHIYTAEELKSMSSEEVTAAIRADLQEDAYKMQAEKKIRYVGKNRAEGMECALCVCPRCKQIGVIRTSGNTVSCGTCGTLTDYDEYGYFDRNFDFDTITAWDDWQERFYEDYLAKNTDVTVPLFTDTDCTLTAITSEHETTAFAGTDGSSGTFTFYPDRLEFGTLKIMLADISACSIYEHDVFCFTDRNGTHYELRCAHLMNARKYTSAMRIMFGL